jgi:hypothetical protein
LDIYEGIIQDDGTIQSWNDVGDMPGNHMAPCVVFSPWNGHAYIVGGNAPGSGNTDEVWVAQLVEVEQDSDGDGVPDDEDACPESSTDAVIVLNQCDAGVANRFFADGCYMMDEIAACEADTDNHGQFVRCVVALVRDWRAAGRITARQGARIIRCAVGSNRPRNSTQEVGPTMEAR